MLMSHHNKQTVPSALNRGHKMDYSVKKKTTKLNYHLNGERTILKKIKACDRPTEMVEKAGGNFVVELSTVGFEAFREIIFQNVHMPKDSCRTSRHLLYEAQTDRDDNIVQDVLRINSWQAIFPNLAQSRTGSLSVSINLYRTTCKALINGRDAAALAIAINSFLCYLNSDPEIRNQNCNLKTSLGTITSKNAQNVKTTNITSNQKTISATPSNNDNSNNCNNNSNNSDDEDSLMNNTCPTCMNNAHEDCVMCEICESWLHYRCEMLTETEIKELKSKVTDMFVDHVSF